MSSVRALPDSKEGEKERKTLLLFRLKLSVICNTISSYTPIFLSRFSQEFRIRRQKYLVAAGDSSAEPHEFRDFPREWGTDRTDAITECVCSSERIADSLNFFSQFTNPLPFCPPITSAMMRQFSLCKFTPDSLDCVKHWPNRAIIFGMLSTVSNLNRHIDSTTQLEEVSQRKDNRKCK